MTEPEKIQFLIDRLFGGVPPYLTHHRWHNVGRGERICGCGASFPAPKGKGCNGGFNPFLRLRDAAMLTEPMAKNGFVLQIHYFPIDKNYYVQFFKPTSQEDQSGRCCDKSEATARTEAAFAALEGK